MITPRAFWWAGLTVSLAGIAVTLAAVADHYAHWGWAGSAASLFGVGMMWRAHA